REVKDGEDINAINSATDALAEVLQQLGSAAYQSQQEQGETTEPDASDGKSPDEGPGNDEDVVDGEFKQV
ncbi:MAG: molecular chaperone DnaK, partial [Chloroflexota bacterium]|nr:molecular chaperone DnaK [Chloroflexota bacterium]